MMILPIPLEFSPPDELFPTRNFFLEGPERVMLPVDAEAAAADAAAAAAPEPVPGTVPVPAAGAPRLRRAVSPCLCRFNRSSRI